MNFQAVTLDDCLYLHEFGYDTVIKNEGVIGFVKQKTNGSGRFYFSYSAKPHSEQRHGSRPKEDPRNLLL